MLICSCSIYIFISLLTTIAEIWESYINFPQPHMSIDDI